MSTSKDNLVVIEDWDGNFMSLGTIQGVEYVEGELGWFTSLVLLTLEGQRLEGWKYMIRPYDPTYWLEYNDGVSDHTDRG